MLQAVRHQILCNRWWWTLTERSEREVSCVCILPLAHIIRTSMNTTITVSKCIGTLFMYYSVLTVWHCKPANEITSARPGMTELFWLFAYTCIHLYQCGVDSRVKWARASNQQTPLGSVQYCRHVLPRTGSHHCFASPIAAQILLRTKK
jgi:hypothetical protein